jgi:hypothetical protein
METVTPKDLQSGLSYQASSDDEDLPGSGSDVSETFEGEAAVYKRFDAALNALLPVREDQSAVSRA